MQEGLATATKGLSVKNMAAVANLECLRVRDIWAFFISEGILFWLINVYLFFEYIRPQTLYPVLDVMPFTMIIILISLIVIVTKKGIKFVSNTENSLLILFSSVVLFSSIFAMSPQMAFAKLPIFISWVLVYFIIINMVNTEGRFLIFMLMFLLYNFKMSQFALRGWAAIGFGYGKDGTGGGPGWFLNSGEFGIEMCIFYPLATHFFLSLKDRWPKWKQCLFVLLPLTAITGMISSSSRGALVGGFVVMVWMLLKSRKRILALIVVMSVCFIAFKMLPQEQVSRLDKAGNDETSINRTVRWEKGMEMARMHPVLGVGYGNWAFADVRLFSGSGAFCHNIFVECVSELGYCGLSVYILMILYAFVNNTRTRRKLLAKNQENGFLYSMSHGLDGALVGFLASGFFVTVLYYPYFWINLAMTVALNNIAVDVPASAI